MQSLTYGGGGALVCGHGAPGSLVSLVSRDDDDRDVAQLLPRANGAGVDKSRKRVLGLEDHIKLTLQPAKVMPRLTRHINSGYMFACHASHPRNMCALRTRATNIQHMYLF